MACEAGIDSMDNFFLVIMGALVFFLQAGFALVEAGTVSFKNVSNILTKNLYDIILGSIIYFLLGYGFSYGDTSNDFIGGKFFGLYDVEDCELGGVFFQWSFAVTAATILSGAVAERATIRAYIIYAIVLTGFIYPAVVYWTWRGDSWLPEGETGNENVGFSDFAGSAIVHMTGGAAALVGAWVIGPRRRRVNDDGSLKQLPVHSTPLVALGTIILIFGFIAFNAGSQLGVVDGGDGSAGAVIGLAAINTILAGSGAGLTAGMFRYFTDRKVVLTVTCNGLIGVCMVAICAGAGSVKPWAALVIGLIAGPVYIAWEKLLVKLKIDDVINAAPVHLGCGWWGICAQPLFAYDTGVFYGGDNDDAWRNLAWNIAGSITIFVWASGMSYVLFKGLDVLGWLRVSAEVEDQGLDISEHGEIAWVYEGVTPLTKAEPVNAGVALVTQRV